MRILVTGIAGFLGSHLARRLIEDGHAVVGVDNLLCGDSANIPRGAEFFNVDCRNQDTIRGVASNCHAVYHCAATAHEGFSVFSPSFITSNIYEASVSVFSAAIDAGVARIIYCSSMARYGSQEYPFTEDMTPRPQDPYAIAKVAAEDTLKVLCKVHGTQYVILVPHNIIGPGQRYIDPYRNVASIMANRMLRGMPPIIYGDGYQKRCFSFIDDVLSCFMEALTADVAGETINVGPDEQFVTINELADTLADIIGFKGARVHMRPRPQEVKYATCSADKARRLLGYETKTLFRDGLTKLVEAIEPKPFLYDFPVEIESDLMPSTWKDEAFNVDEGTVR